MKKMNARQIPTHWPKEDFNMTNQTNKMNDKDILVGEGVGFQSIRRITGYLVGTLDRFNNAKRAEEQDRVKHNVG